MGGRRIGEGRAVPVGALPVGVRRILAAGGLLGVVSAGLGACSDGGPVQGPGIVESVDVTADVTDSSLGLLTELVTFRYGSAGFLHASLATTDARVKFFSDSVMEFNWGSGAAVYEYRLGSTPPGVFELGSPIFQGGDHPPDAEVNRAMESRIRVRATGVPLDGGAVDGTLTVILEDEGSETETVPVSVGSISGGALILRAGQGEHPVAEGVESEAGAFVVEG